MRTLSLHAAVFALLLGGTLLLVQFTGLNPRVLTAVPAVFLLYLGAYHIAMYIRRPQVRTGVTEDAR